MPRPWCVTGRGPSTGRFHADLEIEQALLVVQGTDRRVVLGQIAPFGFELCHLKFGPTRQHVDVLLRETRDLTFDGGDLPPHLLHFPTEQLNRVTGPARPGSEVLVQNRACKLACYRSCQLRILVVEFHGEREGWTVRWAGRRPDLNARNAGALAHQVGNLHGRVLGSPLREEIELLGQPEQDCP